MLEDMEIQNNKELSLIQCDQNICETRRWVLVNHINVFEFHPKFNEKPRHCPSLTPICHIPTMFQNFVNPFPKE